MRPIATANDDIRAMMLIVEPLIPRLRRYAWSLVKDREAADDLVQDCLERAIRGWAQRRADGDARAWLFTILHNLAMNAFRRPWHRSVHVPIDEASESALATPAPQEDIVRHAELLAALDMLSAEQRAVLLLISVEDLSYEQAASVLNVPVGTVMSRLSRARQRLLQIMDNDAASAKTPHLRRVK